MRLYNFFKGLKGATMPEWALKVHVMKLMHWDYWQFRSTPVRVIHEIIQYHNAEAKGQEHRR